MSLLKEEELSQAFSRPVENLTTPFRPKRRLVAAATDILRRRGNPFLVGGLDPVKLNPKIKDPKTGREKKNPKFDHNEVMALTRPIAEIIVLLTCEEDTLVAAMSDFKILEAETNRIFVSYTDVEIIEQMPAVNEAIESIGNSSVEVDSDGEESTLDPEKKP